MLDTSLIKGSVCRGFEPVAEEFTRNFSRRGELGAACAVFHKGKKVVDLWGGYRNHKTREPWEEDTLVPVFSTTKGISALTVAYAHSKGLIDYDAKVARYWPEFGQNGKEDVTVRQLLAHRAGLCTIDDLPITDISDLDTSVVAPALAAKEPEWEPGTRHGYHCLTMGWLMSELIRRADPEHRFLGRYFAEEIAGPLGLQFYIGLPSRISASRIALLKGINPVFFLIHMEALPWAFRKRWLNLNSITFRSFVNRRKYISFKDFNTGQMHRIEQPSANGIGLVRDIARTYGIFAIGGRELGIKKKTMSELTSLDYLKRDLHDEMLNVDMAFGLGFMRPFGDFRFGTGYTSFGHYGVGGSFAFADPEAVIGFAYAPNRLGLYLYNDPREKALRDAVYGCLKA